MKPVLDAMQMKSCDENTISGHQIPSLVLMERAALAVVGEIKARYKNHSVGVICGTGNNGGDGVAIARLLMLAGYEVQVLLLGDSSKYSQQLSSEISIAKSYGVTFVDTLNDLNHCEILVDAIFGIGLSRDVIGEYADAISYINQSEGAVVAVDIPSGYSADTGKMLGTGVDADLTVTFAYLKKGLVLADCAAHCGEIVVADVGIYLDDDSHVTMRLIEESDLIMIPPRGKNANKGTCGKVLVIAGSSSIYGACYLSLKAALRSGSGLVKVYTHENNISSIQQQLPEAMYCGYTNFNEQELAAMLGWADTVLIGPGLSTDSTAEAIFEYVIKAVHCPLIIDADGINILSNNVHLLSHPDNPVILTPHLKEMSRLTGIEVSEIKNNMETVASDFAVSHNCIVVLKNNTTVIATPSKDTFVVNSGNEALATPGSGDVLSGIIASLAGQKLTADMCAYLGAYIHGSAGTFASNKTGVRGLLASDIIDAISI